MKERIVFFGLLANFLSYSGGFDFQICAKIKSPFPEVALYDDAYAFLNDDFFYRTADFSPARRKEVFVQLFARNFGLRVWIEHRKKLMSIAEILYQTILYEREQKGRLAIADFNSLGFIDDDQEVEIVIIDDED